MLQWLIVTLGLAGVPATALAGRWEEAGTGEDLADLAPAPNAAPEPLPVYLRLCRVDEAMDADRRAARRPGMVRAGY